MHASFCLPHLVAVSAFIICRSLCVCIEMVLLLLYAFRDLWKEWGDSNFQIFFTELPVPPQAAGVVGIFFNVLIYIILSTTVSFLEDTILFLQGLLFFSFLCTFPFFSQVHLHVCYVFNVI